MKTKMMDQLLKLRVWNDTRGLELIEVALITGAVAALAATFLPNFAQAIQTAFENVTNKLNATT